MFLNDPASLMGFNMPTQGSGDMEQLLLRNMGLDFNNPTTPSGGGNNGGPGGPGDSRMYAMFDSSTSNAPNTNTNYAPGGGGSASSAAPFTETFAGSYTNTQPSFTSTTADNSNNSNNTTNAYPNFLNNTELFGIPTTTTTTVQQQQQPQHQHHQQQPQPYSTNTPTNFDPANLFGSMNMDPAAMSAFLYNNAGMSSFAYQQQQAQQQQGQQPGGTPTGDETDMLYGTNNGRKRVHRDWEDAA